MTTPQWFEVHDNLVLLVQHLADTTQDLDVVVDAVEKPWKYEDEWNEAQAIQAAVVAADEIRIARV